MTSNDSDNLKKSTFWIIIRMSIPVLFAIMSFYAWFISVQVEDLKISVKELRTEQIKLMVAIEGIETKLEKKSLTYNGL